jgi:predicted ATPase
MIVSIEIRGFKPFEAAHFELAPLTVLTGLNGSGKTSLIQTMLLAREASISRTPSVPLNGLFGLELGTAEDVLNWESGGPVGVTITGSNGEVFEWSLGVPGEEAMYLDVVKRPENPPEAFGGLSRSFTYLSAERLGPRGFAATSPVAERELEVGAHGEFCAHVLSVLGDKPIEYVDRRHPAYTEDAPRLLKYEVEQWLSEVARPVEISGERLAGSTLAELRFRAGGSTWVRSTNMGFGVTYALPIILGGLIAEPDGFLIIENPEAHLHPAGQSRAGVFLAWLAGKGIQVMVETHSDHVLNGIRRGIAEFFYLPAPDALIHWFGGFESDTGANAVTTLRIGEGGSISDWPRGFFDQYQLDVASLGRVRRRRLRP